MRRRGERSKDAAEGTPVKSEMEEEASSETRISTVEKELIGLKEEVTEVKILLKLLTEGKRIDGGLEEKEDMEKKIKDGVEPRTSPDEGIDQSSEGQQKPQSKPNSKMKTSRLTHEALASVCWSGEYSHHRKSVFVNASNVNLETLVCKSREKIPMEVFGNLQRTYETQREYDGLSSLEKSVHILMRMDEVVKKMAYDSEYNIHWTAAEEWEKISNAAVLHILRMESLPRSRLEAADLLDTVRFPITKGNHGGTIIEKYRTSFPAYICEYRKAYVYMMLAEDEQLYAMMMKDSSRSIPLRDASQKLSRELLPMPGLISRLTAKIPDDL